jgi:hypothetical protein
MKASIHEHINADLMFIESAVDVVAQNIFGETRLPIAIRYEKLENTITHVVPHFRILECGTGMP